MSSQYALEYCPEAGMILDRYDAWWRCEILDRPLVTFPIKAERPLSLPAKQHGSIRDAWLDYEHRIEWHEAYFSQRPYAGDSLPVFFPNLGPEIISTLFGADLEFSADSSWSYPLFESCRDIIGKEPQFDGPYWTCIRDQIDLSLEKGNGKWITGYTDLHTNGDLLASLREPQELCIELMDDPEGVRLACEWVTQFFPAIYDDQVDRIKAKGQPSVTWLQAPYRGKMHVPNCDFNALIGKDVFSDAIWPSIVKEVEHCDRSIFHLDGPTTLQHLDLILDEPKINGLQWVWGAGNGPASKWLEIYQKAQAHGKCLQVICTSIADAQSLMQGLKPGGVWFSIESAVTIDEAQSFIKELEAWR